MLYFLMGMRYHDLYQMKEVGDMENSDDFKSSLLETESVLRDIQNTGFKVSSEEIREMEDNQPHESDCAGGLAFLFLFIVLVSMSGVLAR